MAANKEERDMRVNKLTLAIKRFAFFHFHFLLMMIPQKCMQIQKINKKEARVKQRKSEIEKKRERERERE